MATAYGRRCACGRVVMDGQCTHCRKVCDERREAPSARGYDRRWAREARRWLAVHPLCVECLAAGETTAAECVDHIVPHRGDRKLFWDRGNWQSLCTRCHGRKTARGE